MENTTFAMPSIIDSHDMGLRTVLQSGCPKENAYSTPEESLFHLLLCVMGNAVDLSDFDRGHIVMARRLETSISETARLVGCSRSTVVSTYAKWMNVSETSSRRHGIGRPHAIKEKGRRRLSCMAEQNRSQTVAQLTAQYNAGTSRIVSEHTVQRTLLDTGLRSKRSTRLPLLTKRHRQLLLRLAREHCNWSMD
ncbi:transposable element Tcb1 transposase [Trichonephila clavipes]|nr:transposable element Tcb1 transposase [Trichonephila clavipes]